MKEHFQDLSKIQPTFQSIIDSELSRKQIDLE